MSISKTTNKHIDQLEELIDAYPNDSSSLAQMLDQEAIKWVTQFRSAVYRISDRNSAYYKQCEEIINQQMFPAYKADSLFGVIKSLYKDISSGYLEDVSELIHGELFADFLEMADHLLKEGYKDAAAVIAGSALESHLRQLCIKNDIDTEDTRNSHPKKTDKLNAELAKEDVYKKYDQKSVTAWLDFRNDAAHGHYDEYRKEQIAIMIKGIRDFIARIPA